MSQSSKLLQAKNILLEILVGRLQEMEIDLPAGRLNFILKDGVRIIIIYNDFDEYSYNILYTILRS